jgi:hypothetical protein
MADEKNLAQSVAEAVIEGKAAAGRWAAAFKRPVAGAAVAGGVVLGAALVFGLGEAVVGAGAAYLAYRVLRKRTPAA